MPRPKRKKLKFDEESVNSLFQEIYSDSHNQKAKIARLFTKWEKYAKDGGEIAAIGDQIVKVIQAESKNQDQKLMLLKYLKEIVFDKNKSQGDDPKDTGEISLERKNALIDLAEKATKEKDNQ